MFHQVCSSRATEKLAHHPFRAILLLFVTVLRVLACVIKKAMATMPCTIREVLVTFMVVRVFKSTQLR